MKNVTLYHFESCPYCGKVRHYLNKRGISIPMKDTHKDARYRQELIAIGGKPQVPCLVIDGKALYESNDIIQWFEDNWT
jgi:glutaredoxin